MIAYAIILGWHLTYRLIIMGLIYYYYFFIIIIIIITSRTAMTSITATTLRKMCFSSRLKQWDNKIRSPDTKSNNVFLLHRSGKHNHFKCVARPWILSYSMEIIGCVSQPARRSFQGPLWSARMEREWCLAGPAPAMGMLMLMLRWYSNSQRERERDRDRQRERERERELVARGVERDAGAEFRARVAASDAGSQQREDRGAISTMSRDPRQLGSCSSSSSSHQL